MVQKGNNLRQRAYAHASPLTALFHGTSEVANTTFGGVIYGLSVAYAEAIGYNTTPVMCHPT